MDTRHPDVARRDRSVLVVVDCQERLWKVIEGREALGGRLAKLISAARILEVPVLLTEQYPQGLGATVEAVGAAADGVAAVPKTCFSCWGEPAFVQAVHDTDRDILVLAGIEAHICVLQTALDALAAGYSVHVVADGVGVRRPENLQPALHRLRHGGAVVTILESVLFEWMERSDIEAFKTVSGLLR